MRVNNGESINTSVNKSLNSSVQQVSNTRGISSGNIDKVNSSTINNKELSQARRSPSQISEYEKDNMPVSERVVIDAIQRANKAIMGGNRRFEFSIHEETNEIVVKVFNSDTDELIKEIPNEKILDMVAKICEMAGVFVDERR